MIRLLRADLAVLDAALESDDALARRLGVHVVPGWVSFTDALVHTRDAVAADPARSEWGSRLFIRSEPQELVGWGGFKGPPAGGVVELGYEIAEARQGSGLATAAVRAMLDEAFSDERVEAVIAHTVAERNASNRILEKAGFGFDGEAEEDGETVWRWRLARVDAEANRP